jgi:hypothetical protein
MDTARTGKWRMQTVQGRLRMRRLKRNAERKNYILEVGLTHVYNAECNCTRPQRVSEAIRAFRNKVNVRMYMDPEAEWSQIGRHLIVVRTTAEKAECASVYWPLGEKGSSRITILSSLLHIRHKLARE